MSDRLLIAVVACVLTGLTTALLAGHGPWAGATVVRFGHSRGLNSGDLPVLAGWAVSMLACGALWRRRWHPVR
jgi:hypothetical protein